MGGCIRREFTITSQGIEFLHYLLRPQRPECQPFKVDEQPFLNFISAKVSNPTIEIVDLNEGLRDLEPLKFMQERHQLGKNRCIATIIYIVLILIMLGVYIYLLGASGYVLPFAIGYVVIILTLMISFMAVIYCLDNKVRIQIKNHLKMLNDTKYGYQGKEWYTRTEACGASNKASDYIGIRLKQYFAGRQGDFQ